MKIKTFYAKSIPDALRNVKKELGPDALIVSAKEKKLRSAFGFHTRHTAEVVAAIDSGIANGWMCAPADGNRGPSAHGDYRAYSARHTAASAADPSVSSPAWLAKCREAHQAVTQVDPEYNEMRRILYSLGRLSPLPVALFRDPASYEVYQDLVAHEVTDWLAYKLLDEAQRSLPPEEHRERALMVKSVVDVARRLLPEETGNDGMPAKRVVVVVGPTGVGKTTAIAKLGARLALEKKKNVMLMTTDCRRIGAVEQLRTYAGLTGLPFRVVHQPGELHRMIEENKQRDFILVDTAGHGQRDLASADELMRTLGRTEEAERHLVISATTKSVDMHEIVDCFGLCNPDHLLFTKLDETSTFGPIFNEVVRTQKSVSYFTDGQRIPEDLHVAKADQLINILLNAH